MSKNKINPEDLFVNLDFYAESIEQKDRDTLSQEQGTGSLCISVVLCEPTKKNCDPQKTQGDLCVAPTRQEGCKHTVDNCVVKPSEDVCPATNVCPATQDTCFESKNCDYTTNCPIHPID